MVADEQFRGSNVSWFSSEFRLRALSVGQAGQRGEL
jgi:hypothetical protein